MGPNQKCELRQPRVVVHPSEVQGEYHQRAVIVQAEQNFGMLLLGDIFRLEPRGEPTLFTSEVGRRQS